jgi:hypothetical protein
MKLEYLHDGSSKCSVIRLFDFTNAEVEQLNIIIKELASGNIQRVDIHTLPWVESLGNCCLTFFIQKWDQAVVRKKGQNKNNFECGFTKEEWDNVAGMVKPFSKGCGGDFLWLAGVPGEADILLSCSGDW